jgi:hypothetical protein
MSALVSKYYNKISGVFIYQRKWHEYLIGAYMWIDGGRRLHLIRPKPDGAF